MLIYRQKKLNAEIENTDVPEYWKEAIKELNGKDELERQKYEELKNQLDIIVQSQDLFEIMDESYFVSYKKDQDFEDQGQKIRLKFTDTISEARIKIQEALKDD